MQNPDTEFSRKGLLFRDRVIKAPNGIHKLKIKCVRIQKKVVMKAFTKQTNISRRRSTIA